MGEAFTCTPPGSGFTLEDLQKMPWYKTTMDHRTRPDHY